MSDTNNVKITDGLILFESSHPEKKPPLILATQEWNKTAFTWLSNAKREEWNKSPSEHAPLWCLKRKFR